MINCIAVDDEPLALELIETFCQQVSFLKLQGTFTQTSAAAEELKKSPVDLIFLDIQMPDMNGVDFFKSFGHDCMVIFTTAFSEYAIEGFNVSAIDYLLKPLEMTRFKQACEKARDYFEYKNQIRNEIQTHIYVRSEYALLKISLADIHYLETLDDYIRIHLIGKKPVLTLMSMKKMLERLPQNEFIRVHRSFIVPLNRIESVRGKTISIGTALVPLGIRYEKEFFTVYTQRDF